MKPASQRTDLEAALDLLRIAGAEGIWIIRGAEAAILHFAPTGVEGLGLSLEPPHEMIILVRFPTGDGGQPGIEHH